MSSQRPSPARLGEVRGIVIGASCGGVTALTELLPPLPADFPLPIFIVVHLPPGRSSSIAPLFQAKCRMRVKEAEDKEPITPGTVYFAPPDYHLLVETNGTLSLSNEEPVHFSRPAIDVLFQSAADAYDHTLLAIVLTGANNDGADGLRAVGAAGGVAIVQSPASAEAPVMPAAALAACQEACALDVGEIVTLLTTIAQ